MNIENLILKLKELPQETEVKVWHLASDSTEPLGALTYDATAKIVELFAS